MNAIVTNENAGLPATKAVDLPEPTHTEQMSRNVEELTAVSHALLCAAKSNRIDEINAAIAKGASVLKDARMALAVSMLRKPATKRDIATCVAKLIAAFPNAGKLDPAFARILCEDLAAYQPTFGALDAATRNLRRTATFIPTISEVLQELASASERIPGPEILAELPSRIEEARDNLERQLKLRRRREHEVAQCLKFWEDGGWSAEDFAPDVVREAQRRIHKSLEAKQE